MNLMTYIQMMRSFDSTIDLITFGKDGTPPGDGLVLVGHAIGGDGDAWLWRDESPQTAEDILYDVHAGLFQIHGHIKGGEYDDADSLAQLLFDDVSSFLASSQVKPDAASE